MPCPCTICMGTIHSDKVTDFLLLPRTSERQDAKQFGEFRSTGILPVIFGRSTNATRARCPCYMPVLHLAQEHLFAREFLFQQVVHHAGLDLSSVKLQERTHGL